MEQKYWELAQRSAAKIGIPAEWVYSQWTHESANFTSDLAKECFNFGGLTQEEDNGNKQPDGSFYYMVFDTPEDYADYFGRYITKYFPTAARADSLEAYIVALKFGEEYAYFGDDLENYLEDTKRIYNENFGGETNG